MEVDDIGWFIKYNLIIKEMEIFIDKLWFLNGVVVSKDGMFVFVVEGWLGRFVIFNYLIFLVLNFYGRCRMIEVIVLVLREWI